MVAIIFLPTVYVKLANLPLIKWNQVYFCHDSFLSRVNLYLVVCKLNLSLNFWFNILQKLHEFYIYWYFLSRFSCIFWLLVIYELIFIESYFQVFAYEYEIILYAASNVIWNSLSIDKNIRLCIIISTMTPDCQLNQSICQILIDFFYFQIIKNKMLIWHLLIYNQIFFLMIKS